MGADLQGLAFFPGIQQLRSLTFPFNHGISPCSAVMEIAPQADFEASGGTLSIFFGNVLIEFPGCKVDRHAFERNSAGLVWRLTILDRRWRWAWGQVSGSYNLKNSDGTLRTSTERTPQELAALCLDAMGETGYDVGQIPNAGRPTVEWDGDVPAEALSSLCDDLGCRVVLQLDNTVRICLLGLGEDLPEIPAVMDASLTIDPPEQPDRIAVLCGRDRFQNDWQLQAVGRETDGTWHPIAELSYAPNPGASDGGWSTIAISNSFMLDIDEAHRELAKADVFKKYRIKVPDELVDLDELVTSLEQVLPIDDVQVETVPPPAGDAVDDGSTSTTPAASKPAQIYGCYYPWSEALNNNCKPTDIDPNNFVGTAQEYSKPFSIERVTGIVTFDESVFRNKSDANDGTKPANITAQEAVIFLRTACYFKDIDTMAPFRYVKERNYGDEFGTPTRFVRRDDVTLTHVPQYDTSFNINGSTTNQADVDKQCNYYIDAAEQEYQTTFPQTIQYAGIWPIAVDGAIQQVVWEVGQSGATTTASRNDEQVHKFPSYYQRRMLERTRQLKRLTQQMQPEAISRTTNFMGAVS